MGAEKSMQFPVHFSMVTSISRDECQNGFGRISSSTVYTPAISAFMSCIECVLGMCGFAGVRRIMTWWWGKMALKSKNVYETGAHTLLNPITARCTPFARAVCHCHRSNIFRELRSFCFCIYVNFHVLILVSFFFLFFSLIENASKAIKNRTCIVCEGARSSVTFAPVLLVHLFTF